MQLRVFRLTWGEGTLPHALAMILIAVLAAGRALAQSTTQDSQFDIPAGNLTDALDVFSEQSGLQVIYDQKVTTGKYAAPVSGVMPPARAAIRRAWRRRSRQ